MLKLQITPVFFDFETMILKKFFCIFQNDSGRIVAGENEELSLIMLAYNHQYSEAILKYGADSRSNIIPTAVEEVLHDQKGLNNFFC